MKKIIALILFSFLILPSFAETIQLKSGKIIKGKITEKTDEYIKIDSGVGIPITYYLDKIEKIKVNSIKDTQSNQSSSFGKNSMNSSKAKKYFQKGLNYVQRGNYQKAIGEFKKSLDIDPSFPEAQYSIGASYWKLKQVEKAIPYFQKAIKLKPNFANAYGDLGMAYIYLREYSKAKQSLQRAKELFVKQGDNASVKRIEAASNLIPSDSRADKYKDLADNSIQQGNYQSAKQEYKKAIEANPSDAIAYLKLANIYTQEKNFKKAKELALKAIKYNEGLYAAWNILGGCYHELGPYPKKSEEAFKRSWSITKNQPALMGLLMTVHDYKKKQKYSEAEKLLVYLLSLNPPEKIHKVLKGMLEDVRRLK